MCNSFRIFLHDPIRCLHSSRTSGVDHQVGILQSFNGSELISERCHRIHAVTMKNTPIISFLVAKSGTSNIRGPTLLGTIAQDATWYFLAIFSSHFVLEMTLAVVEGVALARPRINDI